MALIWNNDGTITDNNMTMFKTTTTNEVGNLLWNVKNADDSLVSSINFSEAEAFHFIQKKTFNTTVDNELTRLGL